MGDKMLVHQPMWGGDEFKRVHEDERGEIYSLPLLEEDIAFLRTIKGYARGGHTHDTYEYFIVIKGTVRYWIGEDYELYYEGMSGFVPRREPHFFVSLTDSIVMHWGAKRETTVEHSRYREIVRQKNAYIQNMQKMQ